MNKLLGGLLGVVALAFPAAAEAYPRYYTPYYPTVYHPPAPVAIGFGNQNVSFWIQSAPVRPVYRRPIRLDEHCIYKPWNDRVICRY